MHRTPVLLLRSAVHFPWKLESAGGHETTSTKIVELAKAKRGPWSSTSIT